MTDRKQTWKHMTDNYIYMKFLAELELDKNFKTHIPSKEAHSSSNVVQFAIGILKVKKQITL